MCKEKELKKALWYSLLFSITVILLVISAAVIEFPSKKAQRYGIFFVLVVLDLSLILMMRPCLSLLFQWMGRNGRASGP